MALNHQAAAEAVPEAMLRQARGSGQLNISGRGLTVIPAGVWRINLDVGRGQEIDLSGVGDSWWEQVELSKLFLPSNALTEIPAEIANLPSLVTLDAHDNMITAVSPAIAECRVLKIVNLGHNELRSVPDELCFLPELRQLRLEQNALATLPTDIGRLSLLSELDVSNNRITRLPDSIGRLTQLRKLNCSANLLAELPATFERLQALEELEVMRNKLGSLPPGMSRLGSLVRIDMRDNRIPAMPDLARASNLREVCLGNNGIITVGDLTCLPPSTRILDLRDNAIAVIPGSISHLVQLERLDVSNNELSGLPAELGALPVNAIVVDGNPMRKIRRDIISKGTMAIMKHLRNMLAPDDGPGSSIAAEQHHYEAQAVTNQAKYGKTFSFTGKKATEVPSDMLASIVGSEISKVELSKNALVMIPAQIFSFSETLVELDVSFNRLRDVPSAVAGLRNLQCLDVRFNQLVDLPVEMQGHASLVEVLIAGNRFTQLPNVIYTCKKVETIVASDNQISYIDVDGLADLPVIKCIDLTNNNVGKVPPDLGFIDTLTTVKLEGNTFKTPRAAILAKGTAALLDYLRGRVAT